MTVAVNFGEVIDDMDIIRERSLVVNARCPRCHGNLFSHHDQRGLYLVCELGCNREFSEDLREREPDPLGKRTNDRR
jgi:hypothetical protein